MTNSASPWFSGLRDHPEPLLERSGELTAPTSDSTTDPYLPKLTLLKAIRGVKKGENHCVASHKQQSCVPDVPW